MREIKKSLCYLLVLVMGVTCLIPVQKDSVYAETGYIRLNDTDMTLYKGETFKLVLNGARNVKWKSSNSKVASVKKGLVTAKKKGSAKITAKVRNNVYTCKVYVKNKPTVIPEEMCDIKDYTEILPEDMGGKLAKTLAKKIYPEDPTFRMPEDDTLYYLGNDAIGVGASMNNDGYYVRMVKYVENFSIYGVQVGMTKKEAVKILKKQGVELDNGIYPTPGGLGDCYIELDIQKGKVKEVSYCCYLGKPQFW